MTAVALQDEVTRCIDEEAGALNELSQSIWSKPELNYEEKHAHNYLCNFLEKRGFKVERGYTGLETAFKATWSNVEGTDEKLPNIVVICEYDALPEIGHACGHNLIAQVGIASGLAVKTALEKHGHLAGKITVMGTPAEEGGGGKVKLINNGAFKDVDVALMVHPTSFDCSAPTMLAVKQFIVTYKGFSTHAAAAPWEGLNALDAAVMAYNGLSAVRQQLKPTNRVHAIISKGGVKNNIIPDHTEMDILIRAQTVEDLEVVEKKVKQCFNGAAVSTGCQVDIQPQGLPYYNLKSNRKLAEMYEKYIKAFEPELHLEKECLFTGSTDMGNVSHEVPSIHPFYSIGKATNHTREFTVVAGSHEAQRPTLSQAKTLAMIALEILYDHSLLETIKADFHKNAGHR